MIQVSVQRMLDESRAERLVTPVGDIFEDRRGLAQVLHKMAFEPERSEARDGLLLAELVLYTHPAAERDWWPDAPVFEDADDDE